MACCHLHWRSLNLKMKNKHILYTWNLKKIYFQKVNPKYLNPFLLMNNLKFSLPLPLFLLGAKHDYFPPHLRHFFTWSTKMTISFFFLLTCMLSCYSHICVICILLGINNTHTNLNLYYLIMFNITITIVNQIVFPSIVISLLSNVL